MKIYGPDEPFDWDSFEDRELTPEELAEVYRLGREAFTPAIWEGFTYSEMGVPAEELIAELEAM